MSGVKDVSRLSALGFAEEDEPHLKPFILSPCVSLLIL